MKQKIMDVGNVNNKVAAEDIKYKENHQQPNLEEKQQQNQLADKQAHELAAMKKSYNFACVRWVL